MGFGTIARIVASGEEIYAKKLSFAEVNRRIECLPCGAASVDRRD